MTKPGSMGGSVGLIPTLTSVTPNRVDDEESLDRSIVRLRVTKREVTRPKTFGLGMTGPVRAKNGEAEKGQAANDLAFRLKLSAGGSLFRVRTRRSRRRSRRHCFFFLRTSAQA